MTRIEEIRPTNRGRAAAGTSRALAIGALMMTTSLCMLPDAASAASNCAAFAAASMPGAVINSAVEVAAGAYVLPNTSLNAQFSAPGLSLTGSTALPTNPAFCKITATLKPSSDSDIKAELWMPLANWNNKMIGVGNFGFAGEINEAGMLYGLAAGYAVVSNDTGHDDTVAGQSGGQFSIGHPQKLIDFAYRADHVVTVGAKEVIKAFYGNAPLLSYWVGCSLGGLEGIIEAKRYPADYDGIVSGAPPNPYVDFNLSQIWPAWVSYHNPDMRIPDAKWPLIQATVVAQCAGPAGQVQGFVDEPERCNFKPKELLCNGSDAADCLVASQVEMLKDIYQGPINSITGALIFPGPAKGSESNFSANGTEGGPPLQLFTDVIYGGTNLDWTTLNFGSDVAYEHAAVNDLFDVSPADLKPFLKRGGKIIFYIGWNDAHNPEQLASFYLKTIATAGVDGISGMRLFTIPGMNHCYNGAGCDTFNKVGAIDGWVANGIDPLRITTEKVVNGAVTRTRPICAYPTVARYKGAGSLDDAGSFACVLPF